MKTMKKSSIKVIWIIACMMVTASVSAQDSLSYIKGRWNIKAGFSQYEEKKSSFGQFHSDFNPDLRLELNYGFMDHLEAGVFIGCGWESVEEEDPTGTAGTEVFSPSFGLNANFHILPYFIKKKDFRFDLYVTGKLGGAYYKHKEGDTPEGFRPSGLGTSAQLGAGGTFYIFRHMGLYAEYGYEWFDKSLRGNQANLRFGLTFKF